MSFPADLLFYARYDSSTTADYSKSANVTPTSEKDASIVANTMYVNQVGAPPGAYVIYDGSAEMGDTGTISFWIYHPTQAGFPGAGAFGINNGSAPFNNNNISIVFNPYAASKGVTVSMYDTAGVRRLLLSQTGIVGFDTWYHVELDFDIAAGVTRLFIDGVEKKSSASTVARVPVTDHLQIGDTFGAGQKFYIDDYQVYDTVQHTSNFTPSRPAFPAGASFPISQGGFGGGFGGGNINGVTGGVGNASAGLGGRGGGGILQTIYRNEDVPAKRRIYFKLVDKTDGTTLETGEGGGQPEMSVNGGDYDNTDNLLVAIDSGVNGSYYVELSSDEVNNEGSILIRYTSANTAEFEDVLFIRDKNDNPIFKQLRTIVQNTLRYTIGTSRNVNNLSQRLNVDNDGGQQQTELTQE